MASPIDNGQTFGSLVALEGDVDIISTQLRLLPPSSKILVLPSFADSISKPQEDEPFNPRDFICQVHQRLSTRCEAARSFLQDSTSDQPRLVFMNGGTVSARTTCVTRISERITNGEIREAEELFDEIVKNGVHGLISYEEGYDGDDDHSIKAVGEEEDFDHPGKGMNEAAEDPSMIAMRAADLLDRSTAHLQASNMDDIDDSNVGETLSSRSDPNCHVREVPEIGAAIFTDKNGEVIKETIVAITSQHSILEAKRGTFGGLADFASEHSFKDAVSHQGDNETVDKELLSPRSRRSSAPPTPGLVEIGEACLVDVGESKPIRRVSSMDRFFTKISRKADHETGHRGLRPAASAQGLWSKGFGLTGDIISGNFSQSSSFDTLPRTTFVRASQTTIKKSPPVSRQSSFVPDMARDCEAATENVQKPVMVDAATQCLDLTESRPFHPVFAILEDLIIHFKGSAVNEIFEKVLRSYINGTYPIEPSVASESESTTSKPPSLSYSVKTDPLRRDSNIATDENGYNQEQEIDPYNPDSYQSNSNRLWPSPDTPLDYSHITSKESPPTPALTPPLINSASARKFQEFSPDETFAAVEVQNSLRSILNLHFPPETTEYRQHTYPDNNDRLWKPMFHSGVGSENEGRTVDQILAAGCEDGVKKGFFDETIGQIGRLGSKRNGLSKTGKLDIRYVTHSPEPKRTLIFNFKAILLLQLCKHTHLNHFRPKQVKTPSRTRPYLPHSSFHTSKHTSAPMNLLAS
jgi:hypothetical protein